MSSQINQQQQQLMQMSHGIGQNVEHHHHSDALDPVNKCKELLPQLKKALDVCMCYNLPFLYMLATHTSSFIFFLIEIYQSTCNHLKSIKWKSVINLVLFSPVIFFFAFKKLIF